MKHITIGLVQGSFRNAFPESIPELRSLSDYHEKLGVGDFRFNQDAVLRHLRRAASDGAHLAVTPESYLDGWSADFDTLQRAASPLDGAYVNELRAAASELRLWVCAGLFLREDDRIYNSAVLIDSHGSIALVYRKTHETRDVLESMPYELGDELPVAETPWGPIGILICHDRWYPEAYRTLRIRGAEMVLNPVAAPTFWPGHTYHDIHRCTLRSHAYANSVFLVCCNSSNHGGHSVVVAPDGAVVVEADHTEQVVVVRLEPSAYSSYNFVARLRPSIYRSQTG